MYRVFFHPIAVLETDPRAPLYLGRENKIRKKKEGKRKLPEDKRSRQQGCLVPLNGTVSITIRHGMARGISAQHGFE